MKSTSIHTFLTQLPLGSLAIVEGWVRTRRDNKEINFITLHDGSCQATLQVVAKTAEFPLSLLKSITAGASLRATGVLVASPGTQQGRELQATQLLVLGAAPSDYPLQPKRHSLEFLRTIQHLRFRSQTFGAVFRIRHAVSYAIHQFFHEKGFYWLHTPIITTNDAEGAGELFEVNNKKKGGGSFFTTPAYLTVSGQLAGEAAALGMGKIYTFGPTFRAENSNTKRHLAEFWMVEPEMAFYDLEDNIQLAEALLKHISHHLLTHCEAELHYLSQQAVAAGKPALLKQLQQLGQLFVRMSYTAAIAELQQASQTKLLPFAYPLTQWGADLQTEHERYLTALYQAPVVITDYPKDVKAFYMRQNDDEKTVAAMDILLPQVGEIIGGSQREERHERLIAAIKEKKVPLSSLQWYLDTRKFGTVIHSGFGLGLERLLQFVTGMDNIRDVIPFPRTPGSIYY